MTEHRNYRSVMPSVADTKPQIAWSDSFAIEQSFANGGAKPTEHKVDQAKVEASSRQLHRGPLRHQI